MLSKLKSKLLIKPTLYRLQAKLLLLALSHCLIFITCLSFGQENKIDSLLNILQTAKADTNKVNHLNKLSGEYTILSLYDSAIRSGNSALQLARQLNFEKGIATASIKIGTVHWHQGDYRDALQNYFTALKINEKLENKQGIANSYNNIGGVYFDQGNYSEALQNHFAALKIREEIQDKLGLATSYNNIGKIYTFQGNDYDALKNFFASLKIREEINDRQGMASSYINIGAIYYNRKNYSEAFKNYSNALKIYEDTDNKKGIAFSYNNIGVIYYVQGNLSQTLKNYLAALKIFKEINDKQGMALSHNNIGTVYYSLKNYPEALKNHLIALKISEEIRNKERIADSFISLGRVETQLKELKSAQNYLNEALQLAKETGDKDAIKRTYESLAVLDSINDNWKAANSHYKLFVIYRDSIENIAKNKQIAEIQTKYEVDKKEKEIKLLNKEIQLRETRSTLFYTGIGSLVIIALLIISLQVSRSKKNKRILQTEIEKNELNKEMLQKKIEVKEKELETNKNTLLVYTQHLVEKNMLLEELNNRLNELQSAPTEDSEKIKKISLLTSSKIITEDNWEQFKILFEKVYEGFFFKLKNEYPGTTTAEQRLAALIKLNISSKEIASMIGISDDSVKKTRYRLRKKMELETEDSLEEAISKM
jgi:tetratricopeptide (TPR) repeat protein/DNA-binding CsgD family transcriptional regulator